MRKAAQRWKTSLGMQKYRVNGEENMEDIILIGGGQHCGVVLYNIEQQGKYRAIGVLDSAIEKKGTYAHGIEVLGDYSQQNFKRIQDEYRINRFFIAFGAMKYRKDVFLYMQRQGWQAVNIIHPDAVVSSHSKLGNGILIECGCLVTPNPIIGDNVVVNTGSQVNHDNIVESHTYIASGVILSGGVSIGENTLIDDGVIITLGKHIGSNCIIGAGAVVTKNISDGYIAYGNPCRVIRENIY